MHWHLVRHRVNEPLHIDPYVYHAQGEAVAVATQRMYIVPTTVYYVAECQQTCAPWNHMQDKPTNSIAELTDKLNEVRAQLLALVETVTL